ncbi:MAG TPA: NUDIX hydrolase [Clostridia bacterium]|nr:NUDIX hydrolase [Clostridia bacterium]
MIKSEMIRMLCNYHPIDDNEIAFKKQIIDFVENNELFLGDRNSAGHITGSAWVVNYNRNKVLLTHHKVLNKWLQTGGHTEEGENVKAAAIREAMEESGLTSLKFMSDNIFDIDVHRIPAKGEKPEHYHYDIRFLLEADEREEITVSQESKDVKWVELDKIEQFNDSESIVRMKKKINKA